jgi:hypothetical protein
MVISGDKNMRNEKGIWRQIGEFLETKESGGENGLCDYK